MKKTLLLTSITSFLQGREELTLLGTHCLTSSTPQSVNRQVKEILPCIWDNQDFHQNAYRRIHDYYENYLQLFTDQLNAYHHTDLPVRYWRIVLGPWLFHFISTLFDRYYLLQQSLAKGTSYTVHVLSQDNFVYPQTFEQLHYMVTEDDAFNLQLFTELLDFLPNQYEIQIVSCRRSPLIRRVTLKKKILEWGFRKAVWLVNNVTFWRKIKGKRILSYYLCCSPMEQLKFCWQYKGPVGVFQDHYMSRISLKYHAQKFAFTSVKKNSDQFDHVLQKLLPIYLPAVFLDEFQSVRQKISKKLGKEQKILSAFAWYLDNCFFTFYAAEQYLRGVKLVAAQHGGGYGVLDNFSIEQHEAAISDAYFVWGWGKGSNYYNVPCHRKFHSKKLADCNGDLKLLVLSTNVRRYVCRVAPLPLAGQAQAYFQRLEDLLKKLQRVNNLNVELRLYPKDYRQPYGNQQIKEKYPHLNCQYVSFDKAYRGKDLLILDHCMTTFLMMLTKNRPVLCVWDPTIWRVRPEVEPFLEQLRQTNILFHDTDALVEHLEKIKLKLKSWWFEKERQMIVQNFAQQYARSSPYWQKEWVKQLNIL